MASSRSGLDKTSRRAVGGLCLDDIHCQLEDLARARGCGSVLLMASFTLPEVVPLARRIRRDVLHRFGVGVWAQPQRWAVAVVEADTGEVLAWDGWYNEAPEPEALQSITDLDWEDWDDMASKALLPLNARWLGGPLALWLMPTYSVAQEAARLVISHAQSRDYEDTASIFSASALVAYLPIVDQLVFGAAIAEG